MVGTPQTLIVRVPVTGIAGRHVVHAVVDDRGHLILTMSDGVDIDAGLVLTPEQRAALNASLDPSGANPYITQSALDKALVDLPTDDEKAALDGASSPNVHNPFVTRSDLADLKNLPTDDEKAALDAAHYPSAANPYATLDDLNDVNITTLPTRDEKNALDAAASPSLSNPYVTESVLQAALGKAVEESWRGTWSSQAEYNKGDVVAFNGSSWLVTGTPAIGVAPSPGGTWALMAAKGDTGALGPANTLTIGNVVKSDSAWASISGNAPHQTLDLWLPKGDKGDPGPTGADGREGPANVLSIGTVDTLAKGSHATASITGGSPDQVLSLGIPKGDPGAQFAFTGTWDPTTHYALDDSVTYNGSLYVLTADSSTNDIPGYSSAWSLVVSRGPQGSTGATGAQGPKGDAGAVSNVYRGQWTASDDYVASDTVTYQGSVYIAKQESTGFVPTDTRYWDLYVSKGGAGATGATGPAGEQGPAGIGYAPRGAWSGTVNYNPNDAVTFGGSLYAATAPSLNNPPPDGMYWLLVASKGGTGDTGPAGPANVLDIGDVQTLPAGAEARATLTPVTETAPNQYLSLWIPKGDKGDIGPQGEPNQLTVDEVTTLPPGVDAQVTIHGESPNQTISFEVPRGDKGDKGDKGDQGIQGEKGFNWKGAWSGATQYGIDDAVSYNGSTYICVSGNSNHAPDTSPLYWNIIAAQGEAGANGIGYVPRGAWSNAATYAANDSVTYGGSLWGALQPSTNVTPASGAYWLLLASKGDKGDKGDTGATGPTNSLGIGSVTTLLPGTSATASISGNAPSQTLNMGIPAGATGPANSLSIGSVTTLAPGIAPTATITGIAPNQTLNLGLPTGQPGAGMPAGGAMGQVLMKASGADYDTTWSTGGAGGGHIVKANGTAFTPRTYLNFAGTTTVTDDAANDATVVTVNSLSQGGVITPVNVTPASGQIGTTFTPTLTGSPYQSVYGLVQDWAQFQIFTANNLTTPVWSTQVSGAATMATVPSGALSATTQYYWQCRYKEVGGATSAWSTPTSFTTAYNATVATPTNVSPTNGTTGTGQYPLLVASAFTVSGGTDTQTMAQWRVRTSTGTYSAPQWDSGWNASNLTSITLPISANIQQSTTYYWQVRYFGTTYGWSAWSSETSFTTASDFSIGEVLVAGTNATPFFEVFSQNGDNWNNQLALPTTLPAGNTQAVAVTPDSRYVVVGYTNTILVYSRIGGNLTYLNTFAMPNSIYKVVNTMMFSYDGAYLAIGNNGVSTGSSNGYVQICSFSNGTLASVASFNGVSTVNAGNGICGITWSPDNQHVIAHANVTTGMFTGNVAAAVFKNNGGGSFTQITSPFDTIPTIAAGIGKGDSVAYTLDGTYLAVCVSASPYVMLYKRSGDTYVYQSAANINPLPSSATYSCAWSSDSQTLYLTGVRGVNWYTNGCVMVYTRNGDTFTQSDGSLGGDSIQSYATSISLTPNNQYCSLMGSASPYATIWKNFGRFWQKLFTTPTLPAVGYSCQFDKSSLYNMAEFTQPTDSTLGLFLVADQSVAPFLGVYTGANFATSLPLPSPLSGALPTGATYHPGKKILFMTGDLGTYYLAARTVWNNTVNYLYHLQETSNTAYSADKPTLSPDGKFLAVLQHYVSSAIPIPLNIFLLSGNAVDVGNPLFSPSGNGTVAYANGISWSPDGKYLVAHTQNSLGGGGTAQSMVVYNNGGVFTQLPNTVFSSPVIAGVVGFNRGNSTAFSPDGTMLAIATATAPYLQIFAVGGSGSSPTFTQIPSVNISPAPAAVPTSVAWSSDSQILYVSGTNGVFSGFHCIAYARSGSNFTRIADATFGAGNITGYGISVYAYGGTDYITVGIGSTPFVEIYTKSGSTFTKLIVPTLAGASVNPILIS